MAMTKYDWAAKAGLWYKDHKAYVDRLLKSTHNLYPPTGSDLYEPALWKAAHWAWFLEKERTAK